MNVYGPERYSVHFPCEVHGGKLAHPSRWSARHAARCVHDKGIREYRCKAHEGWWHNGHMPPCVRRGEMTMDEWFALPGWVRKQITKKESRAKLAGDQPAGAGGPARGVEDIAAVPAGGGRIDGNDPVDGEPVPAGPLAGLEDLLRGADRLGAGLRRGDQADAPAEAA